MEIMCERCGSCGCTVKQNKKRRITKCNECGMVLKQFNNGSVSVINPYAIMEIFWADEEKPSVIRFKSENKVIWEIENLKDCFGSYVEKIELRMFACNTVLKSVLYEKQEKASEADKLINSISYIIDSICDEFKK